MILKGRVWKDGKWWLIECPALDAMTQGTSKKDALRMMVDWVQSMLDDPEFPVEISAGKGDEFSMRFADPRPIVGLIVERARGAAGLTLEELAKRLGLKSKSNARHYETGKHSISLDALGNVLAAMGMEIEINVKKRAV